MFANSKKFIGFGKKFIDFEKNHKFEKGHRFFLIVNLNKFVDIEKRSISFGKNHEFDKGVQILKEKFMNKNRPENERKKRVKAKKTGQRKGKTKLIFSGLQVDAQTKTKNVW